MAKTLIIFSPTGRTRLAADALLAGWPDDIRILDLTNPKGDFRNTRFEEDDLVIIAVPSFGGRVPSLAAERLRLLRANGTPCALLCVYGNRAYEDTLTELEDIAEECGFHVFAAAAAAAEHSIVREIAKGRPDAEDGRELVDFGRQILTAAQDGAKKKHLLVPGNRPYKKAGSAKMVPRANRNCTQCGTCAARCPAEAIDPDNPRRTDAAKCIACMRCIDVCPRDGRRLPGMMLSMVRGMLKKTASGRARNELFL